MSDLKSILNEEYSKKQTTINMESLLEMVAEVMELPISQYLVPDVIQEKQKGRKSQKLTIDLIPTLPITEIGWGSLATPDGEGKEVRTAAGQDLATP